MTVDLHRTLIQGPFGERIPVPSLLERRRPFQLGGRALDALDPTDAYVLAAMTAGAADVPARLLTLRDLLELERSAGLRRRRGGQHGGAVGRGGRRRTRPRGARRATTGRRSTRVVVLGAAPPADPPRSVLHALLHQLCPQLPDDAGATLAALPKVVGPRRAHSHAGAPAAGLPPRSRMVTPRSRAAWGHQAPALSRSTRRHRRTAIHATDSVRIRRRRSAAPPPQVATPQREATRPRMAAPLPAVDPRSPAPPWGLDRRSGSLHPGTGSSDGSSVSLESLCGWSKPSSAAEDARTLRAPGRPRRSSSRCRTSPYAGDVDRDRRGTARLQLEERPACGSPQPGFTALP